MLHRDQPAGMPIPPSYSRQPSGFTESPILSQGHFGFSLPQTPSLSDFGFSASPSLETLSALRRPFSASPFSGSPSLDTLSALREVQEGSRVQSEFHGPQVVTKDIPVASVFQGMHGYLIGQNPNQNMFHLPGSPTLPSPTWGSKVLPSRIKSLRVVSQYADDPLKPTIFYAMIEYARPLVGWLVLLSTITSYALIAPLSYMVPIPPTERLEASILLTGWRTTLISLVMIPINVWWLRWQGFSDQEKDFLRQPVSPILCCHVHCCRPDPTPKEVLANGMGKSAGPLFLWLDGHTPHGAGQPEISKGGVPSELSNLMTHAGLPP